MKVRPYRYPFHYKTEIEKIISKLLLEGLIKHNITSLFFFIGHTCEEERWVLVLPAASFFTG